MSIILKCPYKLYRLQALYLQYLIDNLALFYTSHLYSQNKNVCSVDEETEAQRAQESLPTPPWKSIKPRAGQDQKHFLHLPWPPGFSSFSAHGGTQGSAWAPRTKHKDLRVPSPQECSPETEHSSSKCFLAEGPGFCSFIYSLVRLSIKN